MQQVHVRKDAIATAELVQCEQGKLAAGAIRLAIESFSVTANNVTYAVVGDGFGYWNFFPAPEGMGIVPMWGHARVIESNHPEIAVGERVYGYLPMATHLDVVPGKVSAGGFTDMADHRQPMSPIYNQYSRLAADPEHDPAREGERMIFGPLFKTGFLIEYFMGLTSAGNVAFVEASGLYDEVIAYDRVAELEQAPSVAVDFAGNAGLLREIHERLDETLHYSCLVGATHIDERGGGTAELPGPTPTLFFAPDHAVALFKDLGPEEAGKQMAASWRAFLADAGDSVTIERLAGLAAARDTFTAMAGGSVDPARGIVIEP